MSEEHAPSHWLSLSQEAQQTAEQFRDPECRRTMQNIATAYKALAAATQRLQQSIQFAQKANVDERPVVPEQSDTGMASGAQEIAAN